MQSLTSVELTRDCEAVQIPAGNRVMLSAGTAVDITQTLGGTYTVRGAGGLFRVAGKDVDALGLQADATQPPGGSGSAAASTTAENLEKQVWDTLKSCYDPEIPVNIVDLGLVYDMHVDPGADGGHKVCVKMTLTAPGCGMGTVIAGDAQQKLSFLPGVEQADVEIVWDPPWHQSMITAEGRRTLGLE
jgi:probable FeS assembly SUF system protein SufT